MRKLFVALLLVGALACTSRGAPPARLSWDAVDDPDVAGYNVYRADRSGGEYRKLNAEPIPAPEYVDDTVERGRTYYYRVTAVSRGGLESEFSEERSKTVR